MEAPVRRLREGFAMIRITLPWPTAMSTAQAKRYAREAVRAVAPSCSMPDEGPVDLLMMFHPPQKRRRDWGKLAESTAPYLAGIAKALGIRANRLQVSIEARETIPGGQVVVEVRT
jgi:hypothetical protein